MKYLIDTDHMTFLERGGIEGSNVRARLILIPTDDYGTTIITYEEQMRGWLSRFAHANSTDRLVFAYARLNMHIEIYKDITVFPFDTKAAVQFERLRALRLRIGTQDTKIAAIALANDAVILTRNSVDFGKVPDLRVEDWSV